MTAWNVVQIVFDSWTSTGVIKRKYFTNDFAFEGGSDAVNAEVWLSSTDETPPIDVVIVRSLISESNVCLLFEFKDPITWLLYRASWFFDIRDEKIARLIETRQSIHRPFKE